MLIHMAWTSCALQTRSDKEHYMREAEKSHDEAARLSAELSKCIKVRIVPGRHKHYKAMSH